MSQDNSTKNFWITILSLLIALAGVGVQYKAVGVQHESINSQLEMKKYELTFSEKQKRYVDFMKCISESFNLALESSDDSNLIKKLDKLESLYYEVEPFMRDEKKRNKLYKLIGDYSDFCKEVFKGEQGPGQMIVGGIKEKYPEYQKQFRDILDWMLYESKI
ncbi:hypothetical protein [Orenia marismortui]|uniref:Uncharacterized protein n=1 Tax=Orenia marismortui TaxID=46469 RepID=A0A4R8GGP4_9FIRM|nr:hypothetical protein [Orenia marismortui]TDX44405.1 hypothetical protein C7959_1559 [Orenia marismortui]